MMIEFTIPGKPIGKGRPRFSRQGGFVRAFTPEKTVNFEQLVAWTAKQAIGNAPAFAHACEVVIEAEFLPPSSWSAKKRQRASEGMEHHLVSPDADNLAKAVLDGLNGTVWVDDKQVVCLTVKKRYGTSDRTNVLIRLLDVKEITA